MTGKTGALRTRETDDMTTWLCLTCEFVVESRTLPYRCPRCSASRVKFVEAKTDGSSAEAEE